MDEERHANRGWKVTRRLARLYWGLPAGISGGIWSYGRRNGLHSDSFGDPIFYITMLAWILVFVLGAGLFARLMNWATRSE